MAQGSAPPNPQPFKLILGSSSVARRHILAEMGFEFQVMTADIDEKSIRRENPDELVMALAEAKADAIMSRINIADYKKEGTEPTLLITSDIVVVHEGVIREKPTTKEEARQFLKGYSGDHVSTVGAVVVTNLTTRKRLGSLDKAEVYFHDIPDEVIENLDLTMEKIIGRGYESDGLYILNKGVPKSIACSGVTPFEAHCQLGYPSFPSYRRGSSI